MSRGARILLPGFPHHIVHRGHNRQAVFSDDEERRVYLANLAEWKTSLDCRIYAFCLMTNHVHLVVDPGPAVGAIAAMMKRLAGRQTRLVNAGKRRTGTLWEGRFRSSVIDTERYLWTCCRYVEMNPVRAGMVATANAYPWSSAKARDGLAHNEWLDDLPLGTPRRGIDADSAEDWEFLRTALRRGQPTGDSGFCDRIEQVIGRKVVPRPPGRPKGSTGALPPRPVRK